MKKSLDSGSLNLELVKAKKLNLAEPYFNDLEDEAMFGEAKRSASSLGHFAKKAIWWISNKPKPIHVQYKELKAEALNFEHASANNHNPSPTLFKQRDKDESAFQSNSIEEVKVVVIAENEEGKKEEEKEKVEETLGDQANAKEEEEEEESGKDVAEQKDEENRPKEEAEEKEEVEEKEEHEKRSEGNEESEGSEEQKKDEDEEKPTNQVTVLNEGVDVEKVKKEFESTLTKENRENLPHIQILQVFTNTPSPTTPSPTTPLPTTPLPTTPSPTTPLPTTPIPPTTSSPNLQVSTISTTSQSYPSPWKKGTNKFKGVRVRLFEGTQERAFSLFANRRFPHLSLPLGTFYEGTSTEVTIVSTST